MEGGAVTAMSRFSARRICTSHAVVPSHLLLKIKELCGMAGETNQISGSDRH